MMSTSENEAHAVQPRLPHPDPQAPAFEQRRIPQNPHSSEREEKRRMKPVCRDNIEVMSRAAMLHATTQGSIMGIHIIMQRHLAVELLL